MILSISEPNCPISGNILQSNLNPLADTFCESDTKVDLRNEYDSPVLKLADILDYHLELDQNVTVDGDFSVFLDITTPNISGLSGNSLPHKSTKGDMLFAFLAYILLLSYYIVGLLEPTRSKPNASSCTLSRLNPNGVPFIPSRLNPNAVPFIPSNMNISYINDTLDFAEILEETSPIIGNFSTHLMTNQSEMENVVSGSNYKSRNSPPITEEHFTSIISRKKSSLNPCAINFDPLVMNVSASGSTDTNIDGLNEDDPQSILHLLKSKNADRPVIGQLNINFIAPKFEPLESLMKGNVDLLLVTETKVDDTFPTEQFKIQGYSKPIRLDRDRNGGGLMIFARDDLACHELRSHKLPSDVECTFLEMRIRQSKWLITHIKRTFPIF